MLVLNYKELYSFSFYIIVIIIFNFRDRKFHFTIHTYLLYVCAENFPTQQHIIYAVFAVDTTRSTALRWKFFGVKKIFSRAVIIYIKTLLCTKGINELMNGYMIGISEQIMHFMLTNEFCFN